MAFGDWHAYFNTVTGELVSIGSDDAPASRNNSRVALPGRPQKTDVWNPSMRQFEDKAVELAAEEATLRSEEATLRDLEAQAKAEHERLRLARGGSF